MLTRSCEMNLVAYKTRNFVTSSGKEQMKGKVSVAQSRPNLCDSLDCTRQAPLSTEFSRQEYWSGLPFPSPGGLPDAGIELKSPALQENSFWTTRGVKNRWVYNLFLSGKKIQAFIPHVFNSVVLLLKTESSQ